MRWFPQFTTTVWIVRNGQLTEGFSRNSTPNPDENCKRFIHSLSPLCLVRSKPFRSLIRCCLPSRRTHPLLTRICHHHRHVPTRYPPKILTTSHSYHPTGVTYRIPQVPLLCTIALFCHILSPTCIRCLGRRRHREQSDRRSPLVIGACHLTITHWMYEFLFMRRSKRVSLGSLEPSRPTTFLQPSVTPSSQSPTCRSICPTWS